MVSIPITVEQLIEAVKQLQPNEREQLAQALVDSSLSSELSALIQKLYARSPANDVSDDEIMMEIRAVRQQVR